jgi:hypothetical protein
MEYFDMTVRDTDAICEEQDEYTDVRNAQKIEQIGIET